MSYYLIQDYTNVKDFSSDEPTYKIADRNKVWKEINKAKEEGLEIVVFELGKCVLDWS